MSALVRGRYVTNGDAVTTSVAASSLVSQPAPALASTFTAPTLAASFPVYSAAQNMLTLTTASFTPGTNDVLVLKGVAEDSTLVMGTPTATGGGITWTKRQESTTASHVYAVVWTGVVTAGGSAITVSLPANTSFASWHSMVVEQYTSAQLAATPAGNVTSGSGAPSGTITTTAANSIVTSVNGDWSAIAPGTPAYRSSAVQDGLHDKSTGAYVAYFFTQATTAAGAQTYGLTSPTGQSYTLMAVEVQGIAGNQPPVANAGSPQTVASQAVVTLDGSGTNSPTSYAWTQTSGTAVTLSSLTVANPTFTAPANPAGQVLVFSLTATNANGTSSASTVTITVTPHTEWIYSAGAWQTTKSVIL